jgi:hypothetical protein
MSENNTARPWLVVGTDAFMSGWGKASAGNSYAAWQCTTQDLDKVEAWVRGRSEMKRVRVVQAEGYRPGRYCAHLSIYQVVPGHVALGGA